MANNITTTKEIEAFEAQNRSQMEAVNKKEKAKDKAQADQQLVIDGAKIKCDMCMVPIGTLKVNYDTPTTQGKKTATVKEKNMMSLQFNGNCLKSPQAQSPCKAVMQLGQWENVGNTLFQNQKVLIKKSTIMCNFGGSTISFINSGQINVPDSIESVVKKNTEIPEFKVKVVNDDFVPLGIPNHQGDEERKIIEFEIHCSKAKAENVTFMIKSEGSAIYTKKLDGSMNIGEIRKVEWNGFSDSKIYDSTLFVDDKLTAEVIGGGGNDSTQITAKYKQVKWVDVKIDDNLKKIDVTLRVDLKDGQIEKEVSKTFADLVNMSLEGLKIYWGRNKSRKIGNSLSINSNDYEVFINPFNTGTKSMPVLKIYASTTNSGRSRNWFLSRKLFYNENYHYNFYTNYGISITKRNAELEDVEEFKHTAAHEIGHEILQAYGGKFGHSYIHKGSSTLFTQKVKKNSTLPISSVDEIDLMKYYSDDYLDIRKSNDFYPRNVANPNDVLGLIWCSKLKIK